MTRRRTSVSANPLCSFSTWWETHMNAESGGHKDYISQVSGKTFHVAGPQDQGPIITRLDSVSNQYLNRYYMNLHKPA